MRKKHLDLHQRVLNAAASQAVENVKAQHTYLHGRADASGEWGQFGAGIPGAPGAIFSDGCAAGLRSGKAP